MKSAALLALLCAAALPAGAADDPRADEVVPLRDFPAASQDETPAALRWMIRPLRRGMFIRLPVMDTDPNRGITVGAMPIWVLKGRADDRIRQIHAPSLTYNKNFSAVPTYRFYYYPQEDASLVARASAAKYEREAMAQYEDGSFLGSEFDVYARVQHTVDSGQRFYGFGPDSPQAAESNYKEDVLQYKVGVGHPLRPGAPVRARLSRHRQGSRTGNGPIPGMPTFQRLYPAQASSRRQETAETRLTLTYDTRDHAVTTGRGAYAEAYGEVATRALGGMYEYSRWGLDGRFYKPWPSDEGKVLAAQAAFEQLGGAASPPFWLMPRLGGKYSLRAYGDGRYVDRGAAYANLEQRFKVFEKKTAGVVTEFQAAPFVGAGTVFADPGRARAKFVRAVVGGSIRAVAKPQVVGSVDFGVGREGLSVFMDVNYSF